MRADEYLVAKGPITIEPDLDFVPSRRQGKPLEDPVKIINHPGTRPVYINESLITRFLGLQFDPKGSVIGSVRLITVPVTTITVPVTTITVPVSTITVPVSMPMARIAVPVMLRISLGRR